MDGIKRLPELERRKPRKKKVGFGSAYDPTLPKYKTNPHRQTIGGSLDNPGRHIGGSSDTSNKPIQSNSSGRGDDIATPVVKATSVPLVHAPSKSNSESHNTGRGDGISIPNSKDTSVLSVHVPSQQSRQHRRPSHSLANGSQANPFIDDIPTVPYNPPSVLNTRQGIHQTAAKWKAKQAKRQGNPRRELPANPARLQQQVTKCSLWLCQDLYYGWYHDLFVACSSLTMLPVECILL